MMLLSKPRSNMKLVFSLGSLLLCLSPVVSAEDNPAPQDQVHAAAVTLPADVPAAEPRGPLRLRDALRYSTSDSDGDASKPYRLSAEERQLLREQLRSQSFEQQSKK